MAGPGDETGTSGSGRGRLRASHADRERVVDVLKAAFVQGRLTQDELDARVGQALAARTYANLAALTADLPAEPDRAPAPAATSPTAPTSPAPARPYNRSARKAVKVGAYTIAGAILAISAAVIAAGEPLAAVVLTVIMVTLTAAATALVAALITLVLKVEARHQNRSRRQLPPGPASGQTGQTGQTAPPAANPPAADPSQPPRRRPNGTLAVTPAT